MDFNNIEFILESEEINNFSTKYLTLVFNISTKVNIKRTLQYIQIMGRKISWIA